MRFYTLLLRGFAWLVVAITTASFCSSFALAAVGTNQQLPYQGRLFDSTGAVVPDGTYNMEFKIYQDGTGCVSGGASPCGGTLKWTETRTTTNRVNVVNGYFSVMLAEVTAFGASVDWNQDTLWLSINIGGTALTPAWDGEMTAFRRLGSSPYALNANRLGGLLSSGFLQLAPTAAQTDAGTTSTVFLNKTGSGNLVQLQNTATDVFTIGATGNITLGSNAAKTISVAQSAASTAGFGLTLAAGQGGTGTGSAGGDLRLQGGAGGGTTASGGNLLLTGGAAAGAGAAGAVIVRNTADTASSFQIQNAAGTATVFVADTANNRLYVGSATSDATGVLLVLDNKNTSGDPTGVLGGRYYNIGGTGGAGSGASTRAGRSRCFEGGVWMNCTGARDLAERRFGMIAPQTVGATVFTATGSLAVPTVNGTATSVPQTDSNYINFASAAAVNSSAGPGTGAFTVTRLNYLPIYKIRMRTDATTIGATTRYWIGFSSASMAGNDPVLTAAALATTQYIGIGYRETVNGGRWVCGSGDGTNHSGVDTTVTAAANTYYDMILDYSVAGTLICSIATSGGAYTSVTKTTNLPAGATNLGVMAIVNNVTTAAARNIAISYISVESN